MITRATDPATALPLLRMLFAFFLLAIIPFLLFPHPVSGAEPDEQKPQLEKKADETTEPGNTSTVRDTGLSSTAQPGDPMPKPMDSALHQQLTLRKCIDIALANASEVKKARNTVRLEASDLLKSYGQFLPKLSASAGYTPVSVVRTYSDPSAGSVIETKTESVDLTLSTSLNLFNGFKDYAGLQSAMKRRDAAQFSLARARQIIVYDVTQAYYQVLLNKELLKIAQENLSSSQDQLQLTKRQYEIGIKPVTDFYQQETETANNELTAIRTQNELQQSKLDLKRRLRIDPRTTVTVVDIPKNSLLKLPRHLDADSLIAQGIANRTDLQSSSLSSRAAKWEIQRAASGWYPKLDLGFSLNTGGYPYFSTAGVTVDYPELSTQLSDLVSYSLTLSLNWTLFDGFLTRHAVEQAKISYLNQSLDEADLEHDIALDIQLAVNNYSIAFTQIETAKHGLRSAEKAYETVKKKYDLGAASFVEANAAKAALVGARSEYSQATYNLALQKNILDFATGSIAPD